MYCTSRMKGYSSKLLLAAAVMIMVAPSVVFGQSSGTTDATATILAQIAIVQEQDIVFGNVVPGDTSIADVADNAEAGIFRMTGAASAPVTVAMILPAFLEEDGVGTDELIIEFAATDAQYDLTGGVVMPADGNGVAFDPSAVLLGQSLSGTGEMDIYLGGKIRARQSQTAGAYTGTVLMTVWYAGS